MVSTEASFLITIGAILLVGLFVDTIGKKTKLPRVTLLLLFGIFIGDSGLKLIPEFISNQFELIADMVLLMVGFLIGGKINLAFLKRSGKETLIISLISALLTSTIVTSSLYLFGIDIKLAILLGSIASATAPAAIVDLILESNYKGKFSNMLLSIVALDDAWGLIIFSFGLASVSIILGNGDQGELFIQIFKDIGGAIFLGIIMGFPTAYLTGRIKDGEPILMEALGVVFLLGGVALFFEVSFLISAIVMGFIVTNFASHHEYPFHAIEGIEWPFMSLFFVLAGASLNIFTLFEVGLVGSLYITSRIVGKIIGTFIGATFAKSDLAVRRWMGMALLPQAGVAIGMALVASHHFPEYSKTILPVVIGSTVLFELIGPIMTKKALSQTQKN